jgi:hypothetical protein
MSTITAAAGITLDLAAPLPREPFYTLLKTLDRLEPSEFIEQSSDERWFNGVHVYGYPTSLPQTWDPCAVGTYREKDEGGPVPAPRFDSFGLYLPVTCSSFGMSWNDFRERARVVLDATQSFSVEQALAAGVTLSTNTNPFLGDGNVNVVGGGAVTPNTGLAWLEKQIALSGRFGIIHAPPEVATLWPLELHPDGLMRTKAGTLVAIGTGYSGVSADASSPASGSSYAFATGPVRVYISDMDFSGESLNGWLDTTTNEVTFRAEKFALAIWEGLPQADPDIQQAAAVLVDWTP